MAHHDVMLNRLTSFHSTFFSAEYISVKQTVAISAAQIQPLSVLQKRQHVTRN